MRNLGLGSALLLAAFSTQVWAADIGSKNSFPAGSNVADGNQVGKKHEGPHGWRHHEPMTLEEARKHAHAHADKLDKMTQADWDAEQKRHHDRMEKWRSMTPEQREEAMKRHHMEHGDDMASPAHDNK